MLPDNQQDMEENKAELYNYVIIYNKKRASYLQAMERTFL